MSEIVLQTNAVKMAYRQKPVLCGLNLTVQKGEICGLLGPNGAGKTTLLKIITGLVRPDEGDVRLFGEALRPAALRRMGCIIERPGYYAGKTAAENLRIHQTLLGVPEDRVGERLAQVGLADAGNKKVSRFSQGMKQRLGIAMALLGSPDLLVLDEPINGLDTQGVYDMRQLFLRLNKQDGVTILMTSHMLDEISRLATSYAILRDGAVRQFSGEQIRERSRRYAEIITGDPRGAIVVLDGFVAGAKAYEVMPDGSFRLYEMLERLSDINAALVHAGIPVHTLYLKTQTLADFYLDETGRGGPHA